MPEDPSVDLKKVEDTAKVEIEKYGAQFGKSEIEPVAFGLNALKIIIIADEKKGGTDALEETLGKIEGVNSCEATDVRRTIG